MYKSELVSSTPNTNTRSKVSKFAGKATRIGLSVAAIYAGSALSAEQAAANTPQQERVNKAERIVDDQISRQIGISAFAGEVTITQKVNGGVIDRNIKNPIIVDLDNPGSKVSTTNPNINLTGSKYAYGYIDQGTTSDVDVQLYAFNRNNMSLQFDQNASTETGVLNNIFFYSKSVDGIQSYNWNNAYTSIDDSPLHGGPVQDGAGKDLHIGFENIKVVSGSPQITG